MIRSGSGCPTVYRCLVMSSTERLSARPVQVVADFCLGFQQGSDCLDHFLATAVPDREGDVVPGRAILGGLDRVLQRVRGGVRQEIQQAGDVDLPAAARLGQPACGDLLGDLHQVGDFGIASLDEVLGRAEEYRHVPDAGGLTPSEQLLNVLGAVLVTDARIGVALFAGPSAVAVHHHPDMPWQRPAGEL
jgi:hypothetical protein